MSTVSVVLRVLLALVVGFALHPIVLRLMTAAAVVDVPSARSSHTAVTPRGGGVAVAAAAAAGLLLEPSTRVIAVPLLLFGVIGLAEDLRGLSVLTRFVLQCVAGVVTALTVVPHEPTIAYPAAVVVGAVWLAGYANAFNFMDGINGISAVQAALAGTTYAVVGALHDLPVLTVAGAVVAAASATFLPWNAGRARIFLGDVGSYGLGGVLGALAVFAVVHGVAVEAALAPLALYLADTGWTLVRRVYRGEVWYHPHRSHVYQRLTDRGWSHPRVTAVTVVVGVAVSVDLLAASRGGPAPRIVLGATALAILASYLTSPSWLTQRSPRRWFDERRSNA